LNGSYRRYRTFEFGPKPDFGRPLTTTSYHSQATSLGQDCTLDSIYQPSLKCDMSQSSSSSAKARTRLAFSSSPSSCKSNSSPARNSQLVSSIAAYQYTLVLLLYLKIGTEVFHDADGASLRREYQAHMDRLEELVQMWSDDRRQAQDLKNWLAVYVR